MKKILRWLRREEKPRKLGQRSGEGGVVRREAEKTLQVNSDINLQTKTRGNQTDNASEREKIDAEPAGKREWEPNDAESMHQAVPTSDRRDIDN